MSKASIAVFGSINIDMTNRVNALPQAGETIHAQSFAMGLGGKGANQAVAASRITQDSGIEVRLAGWIGDDALGNYARAHLEATSLNLAGLNVHPTEITGIASININENGENTIVVAGGSNMVLGINDVDRIKPVIENAKVLMMQLEVPMDTVLKAAQIVKNAGGIIIMDPAPAPQSLPDELYQLAHVMTPNETETEKLTGIRPHDRASAQEAADVFLSRGLDIAIIKLGSEGVCYFTKQERGFLPPFKVTAIDSVAAGDSFNAGLATGLANGLAIDEAIRIAGAAGALATTKKGASEAAPTWHEITQLLESQTDIKCEKF
ncbi:ribokinase [Bartonella sp. HY406]|uniref:ribokinase n=1 Tax=Bartonella sp. HY406 TaxID=2979331 RepID=UPI0021CA92E0|nr:ribokinase [Bartonella sp. HY406]UXN03182.1 ribokinase [Bartonella sp. HY406]